jgi:hypothetical protein
MEIMLREGAQLVILRTENLQWVTRTVKEENYFFVIVFAERLAFPKLSTSTLQPIS